MSVLFFWNRFGTDPFQLPLLPFQLPFLPIPETVLDQFQDSVPGTWSPNRMAAVMGPFSCLLLLFQAPFQAPFLDRSWSVPAPVPGEFHIPLPYFTGLCLGVGPKGTYQHTLPTKHLTE